MLAASCAGWSTPKEELYAEVAKKFPCSDWGSRSTWPKRSAFCSGTKPASSMAASFISKGARSACPRGKTAPVAVAPGRAAILSSEWPILGPPKTTGLCHQVGRFAGISATFPEFCLIGGETGLKNRDRRDSTASFYPRLTAHGSTHRRQPAAGVAGGFDPGVFRLMSAHRSTNLCVHSQPAAQLG